MEHPPTKTLNPTRTRPSRVVGPKAGTGRPRVVDLRDEVDLREDEVLALLCEGLSNDEIAERLVGSPATAQTHVSRAMVKLHARDRAQLVVLAYESGLVLPRSDAPAPDATPLSREEFARLHALNDAYDRRFGWPFILAVRGPTGLGLTRAEIIATFERRLANEREAEFEECLRNVHRIAELRLADRL